MTVLRMALFCFGLAALLPAAYAQPGQPVKAHAALVHAIAVSPDGKTLATAGFDNLVKLWDLAADGALKEKKTLTGHTGPVYAVAFHPKDNVLVSSSHDKTAKVWNLADGKVTAEFKGHTDIVDTVAFSPDGKQVASAGADKSVRLWNPADGKEIKNLGAHAGSVYSVAFSTDGKILASGGADAADKKEHSIKLWDVPGQKELKALKGHDQPVTAVTFGADANTLISVSMDRTIRIWDVTMGKDTKKLGPTMDDPYAVAWDPKLKSIGVCGYSGLLTVWSPTGDKPIFTKSIKSPGYCVAFTSDGKNLISGHDNGSVIVTPITAGK